MNYLTNLKIFLNNALTANKKFIIIPYNSCYYLILRILKNKSYIKNFMCINSFNIVKCYILIEFVCINNCIKKFKIILFKDNLKFSIYLFKDILKLNKFTGVFLFNTSLGLLTLDQMKFFKIGGLIILYIY